MRTVCQRGLVQRGENGLSKWLATAWLRSTLMHTVEDEAYMTANPTDEGPATATGEADAAPLAAEASGTP